MKNMEITAVIITYNEEERLPATLASLRDVVSEIVVVDSYSSDKTIEIVKKYTPKVYLRKWTNYSDQKNFGNSKATKPWILSVDADERLSSELRREILQLRKKEPHCAGFSMTRQAFYLGKWIRHCGWYPDRKIRLFRKDKAYWKGPYIHEGIVVEGKVEKLKGTLYHFTYKDIHDHLKRINLFSGLGAQKLYAQNKRCRWYHLLFHPLFGFLKSYFIKAGILDGFAGLVISVFHGFSLFARYAKLKEIWKKGERIESLPD